MQIHSAESVARWRARKTSERSQSSEQKMSSTMTPSVDTKASWNSCRRWCDFVCMLMSRKSPQNPHWNVNIFIMRQNLSRMSTNKSAKKNGASWIVPQILSCATEIDIESMIRLEPFKSSERNAQTSYYLRMIKVRSGSACRTCKYLIEGYMWGAPMPICW